MGLLEDPSTLVILTYALTGLGHLRVTNTLKHGLPKNTRAIMYHSDDLSLSMFHQLISTHPLARAVGEWVQWGPLEDLVTRLLHVALRSRVAKLLKEITLLVQSQEKQVKTVVFVATHFGLAHQIVAIKSAIETSCNVRVVIVVQVTDDSPQNIWYVEGADVLMVPSETTKNALDSYGKFRRFDPVPIVVLPYPVSGALNKTLSKAGVSARVEQLEPHEHTQLNIMIPISGAAVGLRGYELFIRRFHTLMPRTQFHIVSKESLFTKMFIDHMRRLQYVMLHTAKKDNNVVDLYERVYENIVISLEVTKPSEQAFKVLLSPSAVGGSLLLFSRPVGRQEYDNLAFLRRHAMIPTKKEQQLLWSMAIRHTQTSEHIFEEVKKRAKWWRGLRLMDHPEKDALFIRWCVRAGIFSEMMKFHMRKQQGGKYHAELNARGVELFWKKVNAL